ncbi:carbon starvation protein A [bacterium]|nr:carbon starvation protein A [bacterium]
MTTFLIGLGILLIGGFFYGLFMERFFGADERPTPAVVKNDGSEYVPMPTWKCALIHLLNIAGTGPVLGPIQGILFGPVVFITIPLGCVLAGAVHDYMIGMISMRDDGAQMQDLVRSYLGKHVAWLFNVFICVMALLVVVTFTYSPGDIVVKSFLNQAPLVSNPWTWVAYAVVFVYYLLATYMPIDKLIGRVYPVIGSLFIVSAVLIFILIFTKRLPLQNLTLENWRGLKPNMIPLFFVTVACGIASGFHSTQATLIARSIKKEKSGRKVFFNMMLMEGFIAMIWAAVTMGVMGKYGLSSAGNANASLVEIIETLLGSKFGVIVMAGFIVLPITTGGTTMRILRIMLCELLNIGSSRIGKTLVGIGMVAASLALLFIVKFQPDGFSIIWRYFAWSNQILVVFTLAVATSWCVKNDKSILFTVIPGAFYLYVVASFILNAKVGFNLSWNISYLISGLLSIAFIGFFSYKKHTFKAVE